MCGKENNKEFLGNVMNIANICTEWEDKKLAFEVA